jgi:hypothetical protein
MTFFKRMMRWWVTLSKKREQHKGYCYAMDSFMGGGSLESLADEVRTRILLGEKLEYTRGMLCFLETTTRIIGMPSYKVQIFNKLKELD